MRALYKYPQSEFPYARLLEENRRRARSDLNSKLIDTGIFNDHRYFDVQVEYAKADPDDVLIRIAITNRGRKRSAVSATDTLVSEHLDLGLHNTMAAGCDRISRCSTARGCKAIT